MPRSEYDDWAPLSVGRTSAVVRRSPDGAAYAKSATDSVSLAELVAERDRIEWLSRTGLPCRRALDWDGTTLVTSAVRGIPACDASPTLASRLASSLADALAVLHALPVSSCPFDRSLAVTVPEAQTRVELGVVDETTFDAARAGRTADSLLVDLLKTRPDSEDLVVCHGDACLPNVLVDPDTGRVAGWVDLGRLGVADRHQDLARLTRSMSNTALNPRYGEPAADQLLAAYPAPADVERLAFYRLLDEFF